MMKGLKNKICFLKNVRFLQAEQGVSGLINVELLENGKLLRKEIMNQWNGSFPTVEENKESFKERNEQISRINCINSRVGFIYTNDFRNNIRVLKEAQRKKGSSIDVIKTTSILTRNNDDVTIPFVFKSNTTERSQLLITDHFSHANSGLAKLYNIQRERKIWWMRFSADPSRYYLKPFEILNKESAKEKSIPNAQSITITARLPIGDVGVEHITLVPLSEASLQNEEDFEINDGRTKKKQLPAVLRSVIDVDVATCALIFDGSSNNKRENTLFINRKLAPSQCFVTALNEESNSNDMKDLCQHISNVINQAGLRLFDPKDYFETSTDPQLDLADKLGIPYTVIVRPESLKSGLLELRSRDTTLSETIHISDIPGYLLNIFQAN